MASATLCRLAGRRMAAEFYVQEVTGFTVANGTVAGKRGTDAKPDANDPRGDSTRMEGDVADWAALFIEEAGPLGVLARNLHRQLRANRLSHIEEVGTALEKALQAMAAFGQVVAELIQQAGAPGQGYTEQAFDEARATITQELNRVCRLWPRRDPASVAAALADTKAGRYQDLGDLIRELQS